MAKISKTLSTKVDKQTGKTEIMFRFVGSSTIILRAKSGIFIDPKTWNEKKGELKTATFGKEQAEIKTKLDNLCTFILNTFTETDNEQITKEWLTTLVDRFHFPEKYELTDEESEQSFFEAFGEFLQVRKLSEVRRRNFKVIYRTLQRYERYRGITLGLETITSETLRDIDKFLREEHALCEKPKYKKIYKEIPESRSPRPRGQNTINDFFTKLRTFFRWCIEEGKSSSLPKIKIDSCVYGTPFYITTDERKQVERLDLSHRPLLAIQRDIFVFHCCIGCRVSDLYKLTRRNLVDDAIQYVPHKTKEGNPVTVSVPLNNVTRDILARYEDGKGRTSLLPYISEQKYNDAIKRVLKLAGVDRVVLVRNSLTGESEPRPICEVASSHMARRTFAGNLYKQVKDPNLVGALTGHKEGSRAFARYREIDNDMKVELVKLLE